jgi:hypothetical protein
MRFAQEPALCDPRNWEHLPSGWTTLDELLRAARRSQRPFQALIDDGTIRPGMTRREAQRLYAASLDKHLDASGARHRASFEKLLKKICRYVSALDPARIWVSASDPVTRDKNFQEVIRLLREKVDELEAARSL